MTGFGSAVGEAAGREVRVEVRSVNHRHLQVKTRLPGELAGLESEVEGRVRKRLQRGSVSVHVNASRPDNGAATAIDLAAAERYHAALAELSARFGDGEVPLEVLVGLPGVVAAPDEEGALVRQSKAILRLVDRAVADLQDMRGVEGRSLEADLRKHAGQIETLVGRVAKRMPTVVRTHHQNLRRRVDELVGDATHVEPEDLARELALLADRLDVSEELARLGSHMEQFAAILDKGGDQGRKLEFLVQEILRETNTIGSKCNDAKVAHLVVEIKTRIERLREQVQNVE